MAQPICEKSADTLIIENVLRESSIGEVVTYALLSAKLGRDVREFCRGNIRTATKALQDDGLFFHTVRGEGLKRVDHETALEGVESGVRRIRNTARRTARRVASIDYTSLSPESQRKHLGRSGVPEWSTLGVHNT